MPKTELADDTAILALSRLKLPRVISAFLNRLPLPYSSISVKVRGQSMSGHTFDRLLALWLWKLELLEAGETRLMLELCKPGMFVIDIGANVGFYTLLLARQVGPTGHLWAFEPDRKNFAQLEANTRKNNLNNVTAINSAVEASTGKGYLYLSPWHSGDHRIYQPEARIPRAEIELVALDDFFPSRQRIDLVKMDIQGAEGLALQGMSRILTGNPGLILVMEFWPEGIRRTGCEPASLLLDLFQASFTIGRIDPKNGMVSKIEDPVALVNSLQGDAYANIVAISKTNVLPTCE